MSTTAPSTVVRRTLIIAAVSLTAVLGACAGPAGGSAALTSAPSAAAAVVPVLGSSTDPHTRGFGVPRPSVVDPGGDANAIVEGIRWNDWGGRTATATGTADWVEPGAPLASANQEQATVVASDLGDCHGRPAYRKLGWYFPQHHETGPATRTTDVCHD